ncbi:MAG: sodium:solute symporter family protein [Sulfurospirillaceae bacterium]|nr:sodium:solute symporter family protein [Sulfurospirillaceae bacterium]
MGIIENIIIIVYLGALGYLGFVGYKQTRNSADYLLAGRNTHPFVMAMSYGATFISTAAIVGFGGVAAWLGNSILWLTFANIFIGIFVAFVFFGNPTRKMGLRLNAHTFPEFLGKRYRSKGIQMFGGLLIVIFMPLYASAVLIGGTQFVSAYFQVDYHMALLVFSIIITGYVLAGGLKGVMLTDALQGVIMFMAMAILLAMTIYSLGGMDSAFAKFSTVWDHTVAPLAHTSLKDLKPGSADFMMKLSMNWGFQGWHKMPLFFSEGWLFMITTITMGVGIGVLAQPQLVVRFMTVKSKNEINRAVLIGGIFIFVTMGVAYMVGALTNVWYYEFNEGKNALQSAGSIEKVIPHFINVAMPKWFSFVFLFALISAAMSTLSSQFHTMGTAIGRDFFEQIGNKQYNSMKITRIGVVVMIVISVTLGYMFNNQPAIIARSTAVFFALCASIFLPSYLGGLFWKRMTRQGAIFSMFIGAFVSSFWLLFVHFQEAKVLGLCKALFGVDSLLSGKIIYVDALLIALPLSSLSAVVVSVLTKPEDKKHIDMCFND